MREINVQELTRENFAKYGTFASMIDPKGPSFDDPTSSFYRDNVLFNIGPCNTVGLSPLHIVKRPFIVDTAEVHPYGMEALVPMDGDIIVCIAEATGDNEIPVEKYEAFRVPQGTVVTFLPGVWHYCPYALNTDTVNVIIMLAQRTYANDCEVFPFKKGEEIKINV